MSRRHPRVRAATWLPSLIVLVSSCAGVQRNERTTFGAEGSYARTEHRNFDCNGMPVDRQAHNQAGGSVQVRHATSGSLYGGAHVTALRGTLGEAEGLTVDPSRSPYWLAAFAGRIGWDLRRAGYELGLAMLLRPGAGDDEHVLSPWPWVRVRFGAYRGFSWQMRGGSDRALLFDTMLFSMGPAYRTEHLELRTGVGFGGRNIMDQDPEDSGLRYLIGRRRDIVDTVAYVEAAYTASNGARVELALQGGTQLPAAHLGFGWVFGGEADDGAEQRPPPSAPPQEGPHVRPRPLPTTPPEHDHERDRRDREDGAGLDAPSAP